MFNKMLLISLIFILPATFCGCQNIFPLRIEIDELNMIRAIGLDKGEKDPKSITVTILSKREKSSGSESGGEDKKGGESESVILSKEARTILEAEREFQAYSDDRMFWGHADYYLIGEEAAREGLSKYIDFLSRDHDVRSISNVYFIKDVTAKEFMEKSSEGAHFMPDHLKAIGENSKLLAGAQQLKLIEFLQWINNKYSCAVAPTLRLKPKTDDENAKENNHPMDIELDGYAVFRDLKLEETIGREKARAENFLLNKVVSGAVHVILNDGEQAGLDIIDNKTKIKINLKKGELKGVDVKVTIKSNINEIHSDNFKLTKDNIKNLEEQQSELIKEEIEELVNFAKEKNLDFIDIVNVFSTEHPVIWDKYKDKWDEIFPSLPINVEVKSKIMRTYDLLVPNGFAGEEHK